MILEVTHTNKLLFQIFICFTITAYFTAFVGVDFSKNLLKSTFFNKY